MSCNYADGLSPYHDKGQLGLEERFDTSSVISVKVEMLAKWINEAKHVVVHSGAGISTSAGIPDFRGPQGVWTLEAKGEKPINSIDFNEALPTTTHMALARLVESGKVKYVVSQNIDGLHLRSGLPRKYLSELHGNMFVEQCNICRRQFVRNTAVPTVGQKSLNKPCSGKKTNGKRPCRGRLHDTILDWEDNLPENDLAMADFHSCLADLSIALGTTMQIIPSGSLPLYTKKTGGKLVIINLQPTKHDAKADLCIRGYVDDVMTMLLKCLSLRIPKYSPTNDPTLSALDTCIDWAITNETTAEMRRIYESKCGSKEAKKRLEVIDEDEIPIAQRLEKSKKKRKEEYRPIEVKDSDSDLEVVAEIKRKRGRPRKNPIVVVPPSPVTPVAPTKISIKKNTSPNKTKYEIVTPARPGKRQKVEIVRESDGYVCSDLEMVCESDDEPVPITTNFRLYLDDNCTIFKREEKVKSEKLMDESIDVKKEEGIENLETSEKKEDKFDTDALMEDGAANDTNNGGDDSNRQENGETSIEMEQDIDEIPRTVINKEDGKEMDSDENVTTEQSKINDEKSSNEENSENVPVREQETVTLENDPEEVTEPPEDELMDFATNPAVETDQDGITEPLDDEVMHLAANPPTEPPEEEPTSIEENPAIENDTNNAPEEGSINLEENPAEEKTKLPDEESTINQENCTLEDSEITSSEPVTIDDREKPTTESVCDTETNTSEVQENQETISDAQKIEEISEVL